FSFGAIAPLGSIQLDDPFEKRLKGHGSWLDLGWRSALLLGRLRSQYVEHALAGYGLRLWRLQADIAAAGQRRGKHVHHYVHLRTVNVAGSAVDEDVAAAHSAAAGETNNRARGEVGTLERQFHTLAAGRNLVGDHAQDSHRARGPASG